MEIPNLIDNSTLNNELLNSKFNSLKTTKANSGKNLSETERQELAKAARGFEAIFLNMMLKEMKLGEFNDSSEGDSGFGADTLRGYTYLQLSDQMANSGEGIGIAQMIYSQLSGGDKLAPLTQIKPNTSLIEQLKSISTNKNDSVIKNKKSSILDEIGILNNTKTQPKNESNDTKVSGNFFNRVQNRLEKYQDIISLASNIFKVPEHLIKGMITSESAGKNDARSGVGAKGLMQLMDGTARDLGVNNSYDPTQNIMGGTKYIKQMLDKFGSVEKALAAYNAGPGNVNKYGGIPPFKETQNYVVRVKKYAEMHKV